MTRRHCSNLSAISAFQIIFIVGLSAGQRGNEKPAALKGFSSRVEMYIDLQEKAESGLPPFKETDSPEKIDAHRVALASAIRAARAHAKAALATVPPLILKRLPLLPEGLEYRFMGRDLILRDVKANLIVDFVREAVPTIRK
jgi:hypothetical protein